jgi:hypothetical protein
MFFYVILCTGLALKKSGWENIWLWMLQTLHIAFFGRETWSLLHITIFGSVFFSVGLGVG